MELNELEMQMFAALARVRRALRDGTLILSPDLMRQDPFEAMKTLADISMQIDAALAKARKQGGEE